MENRLSILYENSIIDRDIYLQCIKLHKGLMREKSLVDLDAYPVAMTHLAMALQRITKDNSTQPMDRDILIQIQQDRQFSEVIQLTNLVLEEIKLDLPDSELEFLWLHFLTVLKQKGGE